MKFQPASIKEIKRISLGVAICLVLMVGALFALSLVQIGTFDYRVPLSGFVGSLVAVGNFAFLCLTIQQAAQTEDKKQMKLRFQVSYNIRLILQAVWVLAAFLLPCFQAVAAGLPLLFPSAVIFWLNKQGKLVTPSTRENPPAEDEPEERLESTEA